MIWMRRGAIISWTTFSRSIAARRSATRTTQQVGARGGARRRRFWHRPRQSRRSMRCCPAEAARMPAWRSSIMRSSCPFARCLARMETRGVLVDQMALVAFGNMLEVGIQKDQADIFRYAGQEFNINSPKQLGEILFEKLGASARQEDEKRLLDECGGAGKAQEPPPDRRGDLRLPDAYKAEIDLRRRPVSRRSRTTAGSTRRSRTWSRRPED